ncbi:MAG TPA: glutaminyl-peptide cyclotransferase [Cyclobacteriaceae bacterium]|nr:glutaminyl-peptide cyclotransferase [Cyclobacteriaceae bacterium]
MHSKTLLPFLLLLLSCSKKPDEKPSVPNITYNVVNSFPHDTSAFTEGFLIHNGELYESTGDKESWIGVIDVKTGKADRKVELDKKYFGEGMAILNNKAYFLTYRHHVGFVYDFKTFKEIGQFNYDTEGWGMTTDNKNLIMSDGSEKLYFLDTVSLKSVKTLTVTNNGEALKGINELEFIDGYIFANVWQTSNVVKIDMNTGEVVGMLDLSPLTKLARELKPEVDVLNGIAWHPATRLLLVTGKFWPHIYVLKIKN